MTDRELVITRVFDAPCQLVFKAWTDPKHVAQWWGPNGQALYVNLKDDFIVRCTTFLSLYN